MKEVNTFVRSSAFDDWLSGMVDQKAKARILARLLSATFGNFGDCEPVGEGVSEMRIHVGAGSGLLHANQIDPIYVLLAGGTKASQTKDIARARKMARELKREKQ
jgi:putative addiction module killer protein